MNPRTWDSALMGLLLFLVGSAVLSVGVGVVYARGAARVDAESLSYPGLRIMARPIRIRVGEAVSQTAIADHLGQIGYSLTGASDAPGTFTTSSQQLAISPRYGEFPAVAIRWNGDVVSSITAAGAVLDDVELESETIIAFEPDGWTPMLHDEMTFSAIEGTVLEDALIASEDKDFAIHHGLDFLRLAFAPFLGGGASTLTMQLARLNILRDRSRTFSRKVAEIGVAMALERKYTKPELLQAYVNAAYLGTSRGRQVHGFRAAAREFFGVADVRDLDVSQAATLVALLNQPTRYLAELRNGDETLLRHQRDRVLGLMRRNYPNRYNGDTTNAIAATPIVFAESAGKSQLEAASEWYLDAAAGEIPRESGARVYATIDSTLQRHAETMVKAGLMRLEERFPATHSRLEAALVAIDPATGELLAMTGGKSHDQSQFNRATSARRPIGSLMKAFDLAAAMTRAAEEHRTDLTPASIVIDAPTTFVFGGRSWSPQNYGREYSGPITVRRAIALSKNVPAVKIAAEAGFERVAELWYRATGAPPAPVYPSLALGAVEETPLAVAMAYAAVANGGVTQSVQLVHGVIHAGTELPIHEPQPRRVMRRDIAFVVADTLRAVLDEGTAMAARSTGFTAPAAGKTGTTNDLRDAWFVGFTANVLTVVWVGADDNQPVGLTGAQAALPIWTEFMKSAITIRPSANVKTPEGVTFADIDSDTGLLATPRCPRRARQAFLTGTQPVHWCPRHP